MQIPKQITAQEAVRIIAGRVPSKGGQWWRDLSKDEMQALARAACLTEGLAWQTEFGARGPAKRDA